MKTFETEKHNTPEGATHMCHGLFVKMNDESKDSGWCKVWFEGKWHRKVYLSNCVKIKYQTNIETPEEKEVLDSINSNLIKPREPSNPVITKVEWGGAGLPPVGVECEFSCEGFWSDSDYHWCRFLGLLSDNSYAIEFHHPTSPSRVTCQCFDPQCTSFRKPETKQQREERERLEAAYDLYVASQESLGVLGYESLQQFSDDKLQVRFWLSIVDKTNYRKEG